ncbi:MAG: hypothetical protein GYA33_16005 [Thermogutta sp.]|nr:hypothetical protein [Thermogutta sp.]
MSIGRRLFTTLLAVFWVLHGCGLALVNACNTAADAYDKPGRYKVNAIAFAELKDARRRNREVPIKVLFPDGEGDFPLVIMSHGAGGGWDSHLYQSEHLASHGYVVFCLDHTGSDTQRIRYYMSREGGGMRFIEAMRRIAKDADAMLGMPGDVTFAIDQAVIWNKTNPDLAGRIDTRKIGMMGHSYGAYTTLVIVGAKPIRDHMVPPQTPPAGLVDGLSDPRVTFGFAMSPPPVGHFFNNNSFKTVNRPLVILTGPDDVVGGVTDEKRLEMFKLLPPEDKYLFWIYGADHLSFADSPWIRRRSSSHLGPQARPNVQRLSKALMVVSCDYFLKGKKEAANFLSEAYVNSLRGNVVKVETK